jgi:hypothetical protein
MMEQRQQPQLPVGGAELQLLQPRPGTPDDEAMAAAEAAAASNSAAQGRSSAGNWSCYEHTRELFVAAAEAGRQSKQPLHLQQQDSFQNTIAELHFPPNVPLSQRLPQALMLRQVQQQTQSRSAVASMSPIAIETTADPEGKAAASSENAAFVSIDDTSRPQSLPHVRITPRGLQEGEHYVTPLCCACCIRRFPALLPELERALLSRCVFWLLLVHFVAYMLLLFSRRLSWSCCHLIRPLPL